MLHFSREVICVLPKWKIELNPFLACDEWVCVIELNHRTVNKRTFSIEKLSRKFIVRPSMGTMVVVNQGWPCLIIVILIAATTCLNWERFMRAATPWQRVQCFSFFVIKIEKVNCISLSGQWKDIIQCVSVQFDDLLTDG